MAEIDKYLRELQALHRRLKAPMHRSPFARPGDMAVLMEKVDAIAEAVALLVAKEFEKQYPYKGGGHIEMKL